MRFEIFDKPINQFEGELYFTKDGKEYIENLDLGADTDDGIHGTLDAIEVGFWGDVFDNDEKYARFWGSQNIFFENGKLYIRTIYIDQKGNWQLEYEITCIRK